MKKSLFVVAALLSLTFGYSQTKKPVAKKTGTTQPASKAATKVAEVKAAEETQSEVAPAAGKAPIEFAEAKHSFGKVPQGVPVTYYFSFKNTSNTPVVIENATAQCGCTTPEYPKGAIAKGTTEKIKVTYNAASMGSFTKQVTIKVAKYADPIILTIDGEVLPKEEKKEGGK